MARQIIPVERVVKCHVNSVDSTPAYESGVAYAAGTLVNFNGDYFTSIVDIEDSDTDTPLEAPEKWAITPDVLLSGDSGLTDRVEALETFVDGVPDGYAFMGRFNVEVVQASGTYGEGIDAVAAKLVTDVFSELEDDELVIPFAMIIRGVVNMNMMQSVFTNASTAFAQTGERVVSSAANFDTFGATILSTGSSALTRLRFVIASSTFSYDDLTNTSADTDQQFYIYYYKYKKIRQE